MTKTEILFASAIVHFLEFEQSGNRIDFDSAIGVLSNAEAREALSEMRSSALLPHPRDPLAILNQLTDGS